VPGLELQRGACSRNCQRLKGVFPRARADTHHLPPSSPSPPTTSRRAPDSRRGGLRAGSTLARRMVAGLRFAAGLGPLPVISFHCCWHAPAVRRVASLRATMAQLPCPSSSTSANSCAVSASLHSVLPAPRCVRPRSSGTASSSDSVSDLRRDHKTLSQPQQISYSQVVSENSTPQLIITALPRSNDRR
jgi:hypothetical protein